MSRRTLAVGGLGLVLAFVAAVVGEATTLARLSDRELAVEADAIIVGTVLSVLPGPRSGPVGATTDVRVRVNVPLKHAQYGEVIRLTMPGVPPGVRGPSVVGTPRFGVGERMLLYIEKMPDGRLETLGWTQGAKAIRGGRLAVSRRPLAEIAVEIQDILGPTATVNGAPKGRTDGFAVRESFGRLPRNAVRVPLRLRGRETQSTGVQKTTVLTEGFESGFPNSNWYVFGGLRPTWNDTVYRKYSGGRSGYCVGSGIDPPGPYNDWCESLMETGGYNFTNVSEAHLYFKAWVKTEINYDFLKWGASYDGNAFWFNTCSGNSQGWISSPGALDEFDLGAFCHEPSVYLAFVFESDRYVFDEGVYLDDIELFVGSPYTPAITSISPSKASSDTRTTITITGTHFGTTRGDVEFPYANETRDATSLISWNDTTIKCEVPEANSGGVVVETYAGDHSAPYNYTISFGAIGMEVPDANLPDPLYYHNLGTPDAAEEFARLDASMATWTSVTDCYPLARYLGTTTTLPGTNDSAQVMGWRETGWPWPAGAIAVCITWPGGASEIAHHDIAFNGQYFTWSDAGAADRMDIQNIATHEMGHWWGLNDLYGSADSSKTMYGISGNGTTFQRTLEADDMAGVRWLYPGKPSLAATPSSLSFSMEEGADNPAAKTVTLSNPGTGFLSYVASAADPWVTVTPTYGNQATDPTVDVGADGSGKAAGTYSSSVTIVGPPGTTGSPATIPVELVVAPGGELGLEWAGSSGYTSDGVNPDTGNPTSTSFAFKVKYTDPAGQAPQRAKCIVQRKPPGASWTTQCEVALTKESGEIATGAVYAGSTQLPNKVLRYRFDFQAADGTTLTGSPPCSWTDGPLIAGPPQLAWLGTKGFVSDGVSPDSARAGAKFTFKVRYQDSAGDAPTAADLLLKRNGVLYKTQPLTAGTGTYRLGRVYQTAFTIPNTGTYQYRFRVSDASGAATGAPTLWLRGPKVSAASGGVVTSLAAVPTEQGAQVTFQLTAEAYVSVTIVNLAGRPVRTLCHERPCGAGANTLLWDARSGQGVRAPNGTYLVQAVAHSPAGATERALAALSLNR
jgi:IPT/TIG domain/FlgD Ig-like domain